MANKRLKAMTLIELLIVMTIISIITSVAYPSFKRQSIKAKRMVALTDLSRMQLYLENSYNQDANQDYSVAKQSVISAANCLVCQSNTQHYRFSVVITADGYTLMALPLNQQQDDPCLNTPTDTLSLNQAGVALPSTCWY
ncbi:type IV pilin protein [Vibrio sp. N418]|uniref:type IV pilin protein n=1 Tax=Vibrio sp. (strain N418) TaxID=701176 RepID=UPI0002DA1A9B|nr:type IV pilin protein [Vibrio sp. N418]